MFKSIVYLIVRFTLLPLLFRELLQKKKVTIVVFHNISLKTAEYLFRYYRNKYNVISLDTFISAIHTKSQELIPNKAVIITLDDGYKENYALKNLLIKYNITITVFLCSELINTNRILWTKYIKNKTLKKRLKKVPDNKRIEYLKNLGFNENMEFGNRTIMNLEEISEIKGLIDFQSHTLYHPILPNCTDNKSYNEILLSKKELENKIGINVYAIAYPTGKYSLRDIENVKKAGYKCGLTNDYGFNTINSDPYTLKRIPLDDNASIHEIIVKTSGFYDFIKKFILRIKTKGLRKNIS